MSHKMIHGKIVAVTGETVALAHVLRAALNIPLSKALFIVERVEMGLAVNVLVPGWWCFWVFARHGITLAVRSM